MHRTLGDGYLLQGGKTYYQDENPPVNDATQARHEEMNSIQEEICQVIENEGISLNADTETFAQMNQLDQALWKKNAKMSPRMTNGLFAYGRYDSGLDGFRVYDGSCIDKFGGYFMGSQGGPSILKAGLTPWTAGDGGNGIPSAVSISANTWYYVFCIMKVSTGEVDFGLDSSKIANNLLAESGYNVYRMVGIVEAQAGGSPFKFTTTNKAPLGDWIYPTRQGVIITAYPLTSQNNIILIQAPPTVCEAKLYVEIYNSVAGAFLARISANNIDTDMSDGRAVIKVSGGDGETARFQLNVKTDADGKINMGYRIGDAGAGTVKVNITRIAFKVDPFDVQDNPLYIP